MNRSDIHRSRSRRPRRARALLASLCAGVLAAWLPAQDGRCHDLGGGCSGGRQPLIRCDHLPNVGCSEFDVLLSNLGFTFPTGVLLVGTCAQQPSVVAPPIACGDGCRLHVASGAVTIPFRAGRFGLAPVALPIPNDPSLFGVRVCAQAARVDGSCVSLTAGLRIQIGRGGCR